MGVGNLAHFMHKRTLSLTARGSNRIRGLSPLGPLTLTTAHAASVCDSVCLSVCKHDKIKTAETKITKLGAGIVHHDTSHVNKY